MDLFRGKYSGYTCAKNITIDQKSKSCNLSLSYDAVNEEFQFIEHLFCTTFIRLRAVCGCGVLPSYQFYSELCSDTFIHVLLLVLSV